MVNKCSCFITTPNMNQVFSMSLFCCSFSRFFVTALKAYGTKNGISFFKNVEFNKMLNGAIVISRAAYFDADLTHQEFSSGICICECCRFIQCSGYKGGAIFSSAQELRLISCYFIKCTATKSGGGAYIEKSGYLERCYFTECRNNDDWGSSFILCANCSVISSTVYKDSPFNIAFDFGGTESHGKYLNISHCVGTHCGGLANNNQNGGGSMTYINLVSCSGGRVYEFWSASPANIQYVNVLSCYGSSAIFYSQNCSPVLKDVRIVSSSGNHVSGSVSFINLLYDQLIPMNLLSSYTCYQEYSINVNTYQRHLIIVAFALLL